MGKIQSALNTAAGTIIGGKGVKAIQGVQSELERDIDAEVAKQTAEQQQLVSESIAGGLDPSTGLSLEEAAKQQKEDPEFYKSQQQEMFEKPHDLKKRITAQFLAKEESQLRVQQKQTFMQKLKNSTRGKK